MSPPRRRRRRLLAVALTCAAAALAACAPAALAQDSLAPRGAEPHWLPDEEWVNDLWLPYDEQRLYALLGLVAAGGYASEPSVSTGGRVVVFTSTAGDLSPAKPARLAGVFAHDTATGTTTLLSRHERPPAPAVFAQAASVDIACRLHPS